MKINSNTFHFRTRGQSAISRESSKKYQRVRSLSACALLVIGSLAGSAAVAQDLLFSLEESTLPGNPQQTNIGLVRFGSTSASTLEQGARVAIPLSDGQVVGGSVFHESTGAPLNLQTLLQTTSTKTISLDDGAGTVDLHLNNGQVNAMTIFETSTNSFSRVVLDSSDSGVLLKQDSHDYMCADMPVDTTPDLLEISAEETPSISVVQTLQSNPGAATVLYIDYWGGAITVASEGANVWNATYGSPLNYDPYSFDADTTTFSNADLYRMYHGWLEATEDYAPFDVNVTTMRSVYDSYAIADRSRIIGTTYATRNAYNICSSGCGGVAYKPSFGNNYYNTGFTFNNSIGSLGMTHSHEAGHQMGLSHDGGAANPSYYTGHGTWGPVMGAPFNKQYVQWSKGEYPGANNFEDDFSIIVGELGALADDAGGSLTTATSLPASGTQTIINQIRPQGVTGATDNDYYKLVLTEESSVQIEVGPRFGLDTSENAAGETNGANLAMRARLYDTDAGGALDNVLLDELPLTTDRPNTNIFDYDAILPVGTYYLQVQRWSPDTSWTTGWQNWGHGGQFQMTSTVTGQSTPYITSPADGSTLTGPNQGFNWSNNGADVDRYFMYIGSTPGGKQYYNSYRMNGDEYEHVVDNLPTNGETIYVRLWSYINGGVGWKNVTYTYTAAAAAPAVVAPLPESQLESTSGNTTFYWSGNGVAVTDWHVYMGSSPGMRNYYNSGGLASTATSAAVTGLPTDGRDLWLRLWYRVAGVWKYTDTRYMANASSSTPTITTPWPGAAIGTVQTVYWNVNGANVDRWRVYAGNQYGTSNFTFTNNLSADTRSYEITGWGTAYAGQKIWVRLQWRDAVTGAWSRTNEVFVAGFGPSVIEVETVAPVDP